MPPLFDPDNSRRVRVQRRGDRGGLVALSGIRSMLEPSVVWHLDVAGDSERWVTAP